MKLTLGSIIRRSLIHRRSRSLSALTAMTVSAGVATALLTLYASLDTKLHKEFRSFGANIVVTAPANTPNLAEQVKKAAGPEALTAPFAYAVATTDRGTPVVVAGVDFPAVRAIDSTWQADAWPTAPNAALVGQKAANFIADERTLALTFAGQKQTFASAGHLRTGGDEDSRIYISQADFAGWTHASPTVVEVQIPGGAPQVEAALGRLRAQLPGLEVEPVRQLVEGESRIVDKTHALMFGAVLLIALTVGVSVLATLSASVLERRRDFALMKALGGTQLQMMALFLLETVLLASAGVATGWLLGSAAAWAISETNFHTATLPRPQVLPLVLLLNLAIAAMAALLPARALSTLEPASLLKGE
ncbi:putative ABC transport system permease protein [Granulicella rosea]|uniref:Putative ABC transport system permease protein n=1 Tax=Granulicella rosea TaxID=474952 RepID=A0A239IZF4_9BACT|nr:FtsX-like permease family protein [Granulicella rosea]SNS97794.1 putative ABC transport system permease protein [Granulicella rosea]